MKEFLQLVYEMLGTLLRVLIIMLLVLTFFVRQVNVNGSSMNDTLQHQDRLLTWCFQYTPRQGDIVIITHGAILQDMIIKRVIAVEGQHLTVDYASGEVFVDGMLLEEDYIKGKTIMPHDFTGDTDMVIPEGYVYVMGDNREHSTDSRSVQVNIVPVNNIIGKAFFRLYPLNTFGTLS